MQAINLINQIASRFTAKLRQRHSERLSAALAREHALIDPLMRADIQHLIEHTTSTETPCAALICDREPIPMVSARRMPGGFRATPLPGLPTHMRYSSS